MTRYMISILITGFLLASSLFLHIPPMHAATTPATETVLAVPESQQIESAAIDTVSAFPKRLSSRENWEKAAFVPFVIAFAPLKLLAWGTENLIGVVNRGQYMGRAKAVLIAPDGRSGYLPSYSSIMGGGLQYFRKGIITYNSKMTLALHQGLRGRWGAEWSLSRIRLGPIMSGKLSAAHLFLSDEDFFGIGPATTKAARTNYARRLWTGEIALETRLGPFFSFETAWGVDANNIFQGRNSDDPSTTEVFTPTELPGLGESIQLSRFRLALRSDTRNHPGRPTTGGEGTFAYSAFHQLNGSQFSFWKTTFDYRQYLPLWYGRVLVLRLGWEVTTRFGGSEVPYYYLSEIGNRNTVRGFDRGRFRDKDMLLMSAEYRWPIWRMIDATLFFDTGEVANDMYRDFAEKQLQYTFGGGFRIWNSESMVMKLEVGKSDDGLRFHFVMFR